MYMNKISLDGLNSSEKFLDLDQKTITENLCISGIQIYFYEKNNFEIPVPQFSERMLMYDS